jgi:hypothetical protein
VNDWQKRKSFVVTRHCLNPTLTTPDPPCTIKRHETQKVKRGEVRSNFCANIYAGIYAPEAPFSCRCNSMRRRSDENSSSRHQRGAHITIREVVEQILRILWGIIQIPSRLSILSWICILRPSSNLWSLARSCILVPQIICPVLSSRIS